MSNISSSPSEISIIGLEIVNLLQILSILMITLGGLFIILSSVFGVSTTSYSIRRFAGRTMIIGFIFAVMSAIGSEYFNSALSTITISTFPIWIIAPIIILLALSVLQGMLAIFLGWRTASNVVSSLIINMFSFFISIIGRVFPAIRHFFR